MFDEAPRLSRELRMAFPIMPDVPNEMVLLLGEIKGDVAGMRSEFGSMRLSIQRLEDHNQHIRDHFASENQRLAQSIINSENTMVVKLAAVEARLAARLDCVEDNVRDGVTARTTIWKVIGAICIFVVPAAWAVVTYVTPLLHHAS